MSNKMAAILLGVFLSISAQAAIDVYQFNTEADRQRFQQLTSELRCPKCQNQNLADSNAPIAQDLRTKIQTMLTENKTDQEIVDYMIARYGDFVLYQPKVNQKTWLLWFGPAVFLVFGLAIVIWIGRRNTAKNKADALVVQDLDAQQRQQLDELLNDSGKHRS